MNNGLYFEIWSKAWPLKALSRLKKALVFLHGIQMGVGSYDFKGQSKKNIFD